MAGMRRGDVSALTRGGGIDAQVPSRVAQSAGVGASSTRVVAAVATTTRRATAPLDVFPGRVSGVSTVQNARGGVGDWRVSCGGDGRYRCDHAGDAARAACAAGRGAFDGSLPQRIAARMIGCE